MISNTRVTGHAHRAAIQSTVVRGATTVANAATKVGGIVGGYVAGFVLGMPKSQTEVVQKRVARAKAR